MKTKTIDLIAVFTAIFLSTALGCILRVGFMSVVNWAFLRYPYPIGYSMPAEAITSCS